MHKRIYVDESRRCIIRSGRVFFMCLANGWLLQCAFAGNESSKLLALNHYTEASTCRNCKQALPCALFCMYMYFTLSRQREAYPALCRFVAVSTEITCLLEASVSWGNIPPRNTHAVKWNFLVLRLSTREGFALLWPREERGTCVAPTWPRGRRAGCALFCSHRFLTFDTLRSGDRNRDLQSFARVRHRPICFAMKFPAVFGYVGAAAIAR